MDFENMIEEVRKVLQKSSKSQCYATALLTDKENLHIAYCNTFNNCCEKTDDDFSIIADLIESGENRVLKMVAVFKQGEVIEAAPLPCFEICQLVYNMNNDNINAEVRLETVDPKCIDSAEIATNIEIVPYLKEFFASNTNTV